MSLKNLLQVINDPLNIEDLATSLRAMEAGVSPAAEVAPITLMSRAREASHHRCTLKNGGHVLKPIMNIADVSLDPTPSDFAPTGPAAGRFAAKIGAVGAHIGARKLGYNVIAVPPGKRAWPFHNYPAKEEMFFVLQGSGEVRIGEARLGQVCGEGRVRARAGRHPAAIRCRWPRKSVGRFLGRRSEARASLRRLRASAAGEDDVRHGEAITLEQSHATVTHHQNRAGEAGGGVLHELLIECDTGRAVDLNGFQGVALCKRGARAQEEGETGRQREIRHERHCLVVRRFKG